jgi:uncharacterized damage-inducible protein DinB
MRAAALREHERPADRHEQLSSAATGRCLKSRYRKDGAASGGMAALGRSRENTNMTIARAMLEEFEGELATTRRFLERVPEDRLTWRPHEKSMTTGQLALHVAEVPAGVLQMALEDVAAPPDLSVREQPDDLRTVLDALDRSADFVRGALPAIDDARMQVTYRIVQDGQTLMSLPRAAFLRAIMLNHWYHHRGQLGVYLRLLGASVPSSYGPSGDEQMIMENQS